MYLKTITQSYSMYISGFFHPSTIFILWDFLCRWSCHIKYRVLTSSFLICLLFLFSSFFFFFSFFVGELEGDLLNWQGLPLQYWPERVRLGHPWHAPILTGKHSDSVFHTIKYEMFLVGFFFFLTDAI